MCPKFFKAAFLLIILVITGCRHDSDDADPASDVFLKKQVVNWIAGGHGGHGDSTVWIHPDTIFFTYDTSGRLVAADSMKFLYNTGGRLAMTANGMDTIRYYYENDLLTMITTGCGYYDGGRFTDTTRFFYSGGRLQYFTSTREKATTGVVFANGRLSAKYVSRLAGDDIRYDTLLYTWKGGNMTSLQSKSGSPYIGFLYRRDFLYDDRPCFTSAIHYPESYLFVREITQFYGRYPLFYYEVLPWRFDCRNNVVEYTEHTSEQTRTREWHVHYHRNGFPSEIHASDFEVILEYY